MRVSSFFYFLAGSSEQVIEDCPPAERNYHAAIGGFVLITAVLASLSGGYALYTVFHSVPLAVLFGLFWGLAIGAMDRFVVMTIDLATREGQVRTLLSASFRLLLAVFVAIVVARPLELRIFEPEIAGKLQEDVRRDLTAKVQALDADLVRRQQAWEGHQRLAQEEEANAALALEHQSCLDEQERLRQAVHGECDGTSGTMRVGLGPICKLKQAHHDEVKARCDALHARKGESDALIASIREESERVLAEMRAETEKTIAAFTDAANTRIREIAEGKTGSLLTRLDALHALSARSDGMRWVIWFVTALFVLVESLPVGLKLMVAGKGTYAARIALDEEEAAKRHRIDRKYRERSRIGHRRTVRTIAEAVREQQRSRVLDTVARGADVVTDDVNLELRRRTEVTSRDRTEAREVFPPEYEEAVEGDDASELPRAIPGPRAPGPRRVP